MSARSFAHFIIESVDDWQHHAAESPGAAIASLLIVSLASMLGGPYFSFVALCSWVVLMLFGPYRSSCCSAFGFVAIALAATAALCGRSAGSSTAARHPIFFEALHPTFNITIHEADAASALEHWPVLALPTGAFAKLTLSAHDAAGGTLLPNASYIVGPDTRSPWSTNLPESQHLAESPGAPTSGGPSTFAASSRSRRRLRGGRMMRGFSSLRGISSRGISSRAMGGSRFHGAGFPRGTGTFSSPHRGPSSLRTGNSFGGGGAPVQGVPVGAHARARQPSHVAHAVPVHSGYSPHGVATHVGPRVGGGMMNHMPRPIYHPMAYHPPVMHDVVYGLAIAHVLRHSVYPHHHHHHLAAPQPSSFYYGSNAYPSGSHLAIAAPAARATAASEARLGAQTDPVGGQTTDQANAPSDRTLDVGYDRYVLVSASIRTPPPVHQHGLWPVTICVHELTLSARAATAVAPLVGVHALLGLQAGFRGASPPAEMSFLIAASFQRASQWLSVFLISAALLALLVADESSGGPLRWNVRRGVVAPRAEEGPPRTHATGTGASSGTSGAAAIAADGELISRGTLVQTQWRAEDGGDDEWYAGTIAALHVGSGEATVEYDDGDVWTGSLQRIYTLREELIDAFVARASDGATSLPVATAVPLATSGGGGGVPVAVGRRIPPEFT